MNPLDEWYFRQPEPSRSILLFFREQFLQSDDNISETLSFGLPFFKFKRKMLCYFHFHKKLGKYYISFNKGKELNFPELMQEDRKLFKILLLEENENLPMDLIWKILDEIKAKI